MDEIDRNAKLIWNYMLLKQSLEKADIILCLGSIDDRVAKYATKLFIQGYGHYILFSGGAGHKNDLLRTSWPEATEAEHFANIALSDGVNQSKVLVENQSTNTGENISFSYDFLKRKDLTPRSVIVVQKPYMERRTWATFKKQWPDQKVKIMVASPPIPYETYFNEANPKEMVINIMVGDLQRIKEYPKLGYQIEQEIPEAVWQAYQNLVSLGFNKHLIKAAQ